MAKIMFDNARAVSFIGEGEGDPTPKAEPKVEPKAGPKGGTINFTPEQQAHIQSEIDKAKNEVRASATGLVEEINNLKKISNLTNEEKQGLEDRVAGLTQTLRTKEEQAADEIRQVKTEFTEQITSLSGERDQWRDRFSNLSITNALTTACVTPGQEAINPEVVVSLLAQKSALEEALDAEGKPTGQLVPFVNLDTLDKDKNPITLKLSPAEAVKKMASDNRFMHLFKGSGSGGIGGQGGHGAAGDQESLRQELLNDTEKYIKFRTDHPAEFKKLFGLV
jgi:hypothetical protein